MNLLPKNKDNCPFLLLAPMEGVGDRVFRKAIATIGGFDEAVRDFLRVPKNAHVKSLAVQYEANELGSIPLACQLMGSDIDLMAEMAREVESRGALRIDVNCGCPSNTVNGRGAGSSLLKDPTFLCEVVKSVVQAVSVPVTVKMRSGFQDISLFKENMLAAQESGAKYITLHPRTKIEGYGPPARWELIREAKSLLTIPVVGNGDILNVQDAVNMIKETGCDALMIGRGAVINPFIFHEIKNHFSNRFYKGSWKDLEHYLNTYFSSIESVRPKLKINKIKQLFGFLFKGNEALLEKRIVMLRSKIEDPEEFLAFSSALLKENSTF